MVGKGNPYDTTLEEIFWDVLKLQSHANRYKRYIVPVLSVQMDFYLRVFVRIYT